jgi:uncharacterized protein YyaL (SSP411 family)
MPAFEVLSDAVAWLPWGNVAFARARAEGKPVLLSIVASWCQSCHEMDTTTYVDPSIATFINKRFIPVRVDVDRRPDIGERYSLGGWPTTAFLTPGGALLGGGTFVSRERMLPVLGRVVDAFAARADEDPDEASAVAGSTSPRPEASRSTLREVAFESYDREHGGFGSGPKFPLVAPLHLAIDLALEEDESSFRLMVEASLDAMGWGGLYDEVDGGFYRYTTTRDWLAPHSEKLLEPNAALLRLYLDAGAAFGIARFTERAADVLRYIQTWLADPVDGGWWGSQRADGAYHAAASPEERRSLAPPPVSHVLYADANAAMVSAALQAADVFADDGLRDFALKSFERVLLACYKPGAGVAHWFDGQPGIRGLLTDQFAMAAASLDAFELTDNIVYEMMAEELAHYAVRMMWDEAGGGFFDRAEDPAQPGVGLMRRRLKPFDANCDLSRTLRRLAATSGNHDFSSFADRTLAAMEPVAAEQGPMAAHYLLAIRAAAVR